MHCLILVFSCFIVGLQAAVYLQMQDELSEHQQQCYNQDKTVFFNTDDVMPNEKEGCVKTVCRGRLVPGQILIEIQSCGAVSAMPPCKVIDEDLSKPYPQCCKTFQCPKMKDIKQ